MKSALVLMLSLAAASFAADPKPVKEPEMRTQSSATGEVKRLGSVTWDLETHKLVWVIQKGSMVNGEFVPSSEDRYSITPDEARMAVADEERAFDGQEAASLHRLLDVLSLYCAESVVWWNEGEGVPVTKPSKTVDKPAVDEKPVKVGNPEPPKKPQYKAPSDHLVARVQF